MSTSNGYVRPAAGNEPPRRLSPREAARLRARKAMRARERGTGQETRRAPRPSILASLALAPPERRRARLWLGVVAAFAALALAWAVFSGSEQRAAAPATGYETLSYVCYDHVSGRRYGRVELSVARGEQAGSVVADPFEVLARCHAAYGMGMDRAGFELETWLKLLKDANTYPPGMRYD